jgi:hypothetical protein
MYGVCKLCIILLLVPQFLVILDRGLPEMGHHSFLEEETFVMFGLQTNKQVTIQTPHIDT